MRSKLLIVFIFICLVCALLVFRLAEITLWRGAAFFDLAQHNRYFNKLEPAERGIFLDRYGEPLVLNTKRYLRYVSKDSFYSPTTPIEQEEALALLASDSASVTHEFTRHYLYNSALSSVLGYVSPVTAEDLEKEALPLTSRLGRLGLEQAFEISLRSKAAVKQFETNALGQKQRLVTWKSPSYGQSIRTTLDPQLSLLSEQAMQGQKGAVVIMDAASGELLTLLSYPSFDPNVFGSDDPTKRDQLSAYLQDPNQVFFNRASSGVYPPGSVFKMITALAALQEEAIRFDTQVDDQGTLEVGDFAYANWYFTQYGRVEGLVDVRRALARSNDIFFYKAAEWLGPSKLAEYARAFGLGSVTGVELPQEAVGLVPDPAWKEQTRGESWYLGNTYHFGIGQGDVLVTPLQIARMTQALANQGSLCQASLVQSTKHHCQDLGLRQEHIELVLAGMQDACSQGGTAYPLFGYNTNQQRVACKTGTAEFGAADERGYRKTHAWLTAIISLDGVTLQPQFQDHRDQFPEQLVITVLVESDEIDPYKEGSADAGSVVAAILAGLLAE